MKLSGKKDPVACISGKSLRKNHSQRDTDGAILQLWSVTSFSVQTSARENLSGR
jgi:hypothetical protein